MDGGRTPSVVQRSDLEKFRALDCIVGVGQEFRSDGLIRPNVPHVDTCWRWISCKSVSERTRASLVHYSSGNISAHSWFLGRLHAKAPSLRDPRVGCTLS